MKKYLDKVMGFVLVGLILCSLTPITAFAGEENSLAAASNEAPPTAGIQSLVAPDADAGETATETGTEEAVASDPAEATEAEQAPPQTEEAIATDPAAPTETPEAEERAPSAAAEDGAKITAYGNLSEVVTFETDQSIYAIYTTRYGNMKVTFHVTEGSDATTDDPIKKTISSSYPSYQYKIGRDGPPAPKPPEGYTFVGWSTSETERKLFDVHRTPITESIDLYAWFETGVVKVGTELELRSAVGYSTAPITIELTNDINLTDPLAEVPDAGIDIYPAMDPYNQYAGYRQALYIKPGQDITLTGTCSIAATVTTSKYTVTNGNVVSVYGKLTLDGPTITQIGADGVIHGIATGRSVNYPDGTPTPTVIFKSGNVCGVYLGIAVGNGHLEMEGGNIYNNGNGTRKSISNGGGVSVGGSVSYGATANISGGNIYNNSASEGGGVYVSSGGHPDVWLNITGGKIYNNTAGRYGGGVAYNNGSNPLTISGGEIYGNTAGKYGGGVYFAYSSSGLHLNMTGGNIYDNTAGTDGGGIYTYADLNISGGAIYENSAVNGGGIYCDDYYSVRNGIVQALNISGTVSIRDNVAAAPDTASRGGGIFAEAKVAMNMSGGEISGNEATDGGGVYLQGDATVSGGEINGNTATDSGGGIYTEDYSKLTVSENVTFSGNIANKLTRLLETDEDFTTYRAKISVPDGKWSVTGVKYGYNNYDINHLGSEYETVTVRFVAGSGGSLSGVTEYTGIVKGAMFGEAVSVPSVQAAEGYVFEGWSPALPSSGQAVTEDTTYTATFVKKPVTTPSTPPATTTPTTPSPTQTPPPVAPQAQTVRPVITAPAVTRTAPPMAEPDTQESPAPIDEAVFVEEPQTPTDSSQSDAAWALINLILCVMGAILALITLIRMILRKKREEEVMGREENGGRTQWLVVSVAMGLLGVIVFLLTENTQLPMIWVDKWTIVNLIIFAVGIAGALLTFKNKEDNDEGAEMSM